MKFMCLAMVAYLLSMAAGCDKDRPPASANAAQDVETAAPASDQQFVKSFVDAANSGDPDRLRALVHKSCLAAIDDTNRTFIDQMLERDARRQIPVDYKAEVTPIGDDQPLPFEGMVQYPVRPTHLVQIDFDQGPRHATTIVRHAVHENGAWWLVVAIPSRGINSAD